MRDKDLLIMVITTVVLLLGILTGVILRLDNDPRDTETGQETTLTPTEDVSATVSTTEGVVLRQGATYEQARAWLAIGLVCMAVALTLWGYIDRNQTEAWDYLDNAVRVKLGVAWTLFIIAAVAAIPLVIGYGYKVLSYIK